LVGGYWSRFIVFVPSAITLVSFFRDGGRSSTVVGHSPLGALSVVALLLAALVQVTAGLMSDDEVLATGPLVGKVPPDWVTVATFFHTEVGKLILIGLVILHVGAIGFYRFKKSENLVLPMLVGDKDLPDAHISSRDDAMTRLGALATLGVCALLVAGLLRWAQ
jgi:cytochrome b